MHYRSLGHSDLQVSALSIGALHFGVYLDEAQSTRVIHHAIDHGVNLIDTGPFYGHEKSEGIVGRAVGKRRSDIVIATKVGLLPEQRPDGAMGGRVAHLTPETVRLSLEKSLRALNTDYVDLYQLHAFDPDASVTDLIEVLLRLQEEGKTRHFGTVNFSDTELDLMMNGFLDVGSKGFAGCQVHYNLLERRAEHRLLQRCVDLENGVIANRVLMRGILTGKYVKDRPFPENSRATDSARVRDQMNDDILRCVEEVARYTEQGRHTMSGLAIIWVLANPAVSSALVGVRDIEQLDSCLAALEWNLSKEETIEIDNVIRTCGLMDNVALQPEYFLER